MRWFIGYVPLFLPGVLLTIVVSVLVARRVAVRLGSSGWVAFLLLTSLGVILAATLTPLADAIEGGVTGTGVCDTRRFGWAPLSTYLGVNEASMNVLMFVPLGIAIGALRGASARWLVFGAFALPWVIEVTQLLVPALARGCETADIVDNTTGLVIGLLLGMAGTRIVARSRHPVTP